MPKRTWTDELLIEAVENSETYADVIKYLGLTANGNYETIQRHIKRLEIDISHFISQSEFAKRMNKTGKLSNRIPTKELLVKNCTHSRGSVKRRLFSEAYKEKKCEMCGVDENWHGRKMSLILDHINGINNDNRLENLRILCPNCNATLDTHCGKKVPTVEEVKERRKIWKEKLIKRSIENRMVKRPPYGFLVKEIEKNGFSAAGRKYGVSDNAIRKWVKFYKKIE